MHSHATYFSAIKLAPPAATKEALLSRQLAGEGRGESKYFKGPLSRWIRVIETPRSRVFANVCRSRSWCFFEGQNFLPFQRRVLEVLIIIAQKVNLKVRGARGGK